MKASETSTIAFRSAISLRNAIQKRELSPVELTRALLEQIERINPRVNAFTIILAEEALAAAKRAEDALYSGQALGLLHGLPLTFKDTVATAGVRTTYGSLAYKENVPSKSALSVDRLLGAGAILLGKTTCPEFGLKATTESRLYGTTNNPWKLTHTVGGSSGGAAASVAAGMCPLAQGGDWGGSVRIPASCCGVVGFKPSFGLIPLYEHPVANFRTIAHHGPIARTVADVALMLDAWVGADDRDPMSFDADRNFSTAVLEPSIAKLKVAYSPDLGLGTVSSEVRAKIEGALKVFGSDLGTQVEEVSLDLQYAESAYMDIFRVEALMTFKNDLEPHISSIDVDPYLMQLAEEGRCISGADLGNSLFVVQGKLYDTIQSLFNSYDLLLTPTLATPAFPHTGHHPGPETIEGVEINSLLGWLRTYPFNMTGHPAISVPCGFSSDGLPIGLQIIGGRHKDALVLKAAAAFEKAAPWADLRPEVL
jgi:aspartyl-tRNA(Asn)/glutamyl-tRNA(Gln) amidotransferase subunit A